jgi:hypothetical protein
MTDDDASRHSMKTEMICGSWDNTELIQDNKGNEDNEYLTVSGDTHTHTWPRKAEREKINTILWEKGKELA